MVNKDVYIYKPRFAIASRGSLYKETAIKLLTTSTRHSWRNGTATADRDWRRRRCGLWLGRHRSLSLSADHPNYRHRSN